MMYSHRHHSVSRCQARFISDLKQLNGASITRLHALLIHCKVIGNPSARMRTLRAPKRKFGACPLIFCML